MIVTIVAALCGACWQRNHCGRRGSRTVTIVPCACDLRRKNDLFFYFPISSLTRAQGTMVTEGIKPFLAADFSARVSTMPKGQWGQPTYPSLEAFQAAIAPITKERHA
jgi:hypothetical protein